MTSFWIFAALLIVAALAFVLPPLLRRGAPSSAAHAQSPAGNALNAAVYRDQLGELDADRQAGTLNDAQYERARLELEQRLLEDIAAEKQPVVAAQPASRVTAVIAGLAVPLIAVGLYIAVGNPNALAPVAAMPSHAATDNVTPQQIEAMVAKLAERMKKNPDDPKGWIMLAKSYAVMGRFDDAVAAYGKANERVPNNADLLADHADALAMAKGQSLQGEPEALVLRALKVDPNHVKALALLGTAAFDRKDYANALKSWEKAAALVPAGSPIAGSLTSSIAEARGLAGGAGVVKAADTVAAEKPAAEKADKVDKAAANNASGVSGKVTLAPALTGKAAPGDTVFIFARAAEGPRMPLAIIRKKVSDLPLTFVLDDSTAMSPAARLSGTPQVIVGARISKSGDAMPKPGDFQGFTKPITNNAKNIAIVIDTEIQ
jgi:cytochrome c-type biogenesis protein CcmH